MEKTELKPKAAPASDSPKKARLSEAEKERDAILRALQAGAMNKRRDPVKKKR